MIETTRKEVEAYYTIDKGQEHNAEVVYGDTDSVMVKFGPTDLETVMRLGGEAAEFVSTKFERPIKLEFEKVYFPYLLINKKRYAGLYWTRPEKYDKMDSKGIEVGERRVGGEVMLKISANRLSDETTADWSPQSSRHAYTKC